MRESVILKIRDAAPRLGVHLASPAARASGPVRVDRPATVNGLWESLAGTDSESGDIQIFLDGRLDAVGSARMAGISLAVMAWPA